MAFLDDLKTKMSTPGADRYSEERFSQALPKIVEQETTTQLSDAVPPILTNIEEEARKRRKKIYLVLGIVIGVVLVAGVTFWGIMAYRKAHIVDQNSIGLVIGGPESVPSGESAKVTAKVTNNSGVIWQNVILEIQAPAGFAVDKADPKVQTTDGTLKWGVGRLAPRESASFLLDGRLVGKANTTANFIANITLTPENAPQIKQTKKQFATVGVDESLVQISLIAPPQAASGERMKVKIIYQNKKTADALGVRISLAEPSGFTLLESNPPVTGSNLEWNFPQLAQQSQGEIVFNGTIQGDPDVVRTFKATLGFVGTDGTFLYQNDVQATTAIARRALTVAQIFNKQLDALKVNPSDTVEAKVQVKNTGDIGLRDLIVKTSFSGVGLDPTAVESVGGFYDSRLNSITWTAASVPALKTLRAGETAEMSYRFRVLSISSLPFTKETDKNFAVTAQTSADSPDIPTPIGGEKIISSGVFQIMLNSVLKINLAGYYDDGRTGLPAGVGPQPPRVGAETIYTIRVRLANTSSDVTDGVYRTTLPEGIRWINNKYTTTGNVTYDERTREIKWLIGIIPARSGSGLPGPEFDFQVGVTPSLNQVGSKPVLCLGGSLDGTDSFSTSRLHAVNEVVTTELVNEALSDVVR
ncbi:MAG: hypothetical protein Q7S57_01950 [bacterium]|nr:hypothetical protein [bacterium]